MWAIWAFLHRTAEGAQDPVWSSQMMTLQVLKCLKSESGVCVAQNFWNYHAGTPRQLDWSFLTIIARVYGDQTLELDGAMEYEPTYNYGGPTL